MIGGASIYVIGCDVGTQSTKAILLDQEGLVVARAASGYGTMHPAAGWAEQDPRDWDRALAAVVREVIAIAAISPGDVAVLAVAAQVDGIVAVDAAGEPLALAPIWMDRRAIAETRELADRVGVDTIRAITGLNVDASHGAPKATWLRRSVEEPIAAYLVPAAYLVARLTGERVLDQANASCLLLYDITARDWSPVLLEATHLDASSLGDVRVATDVAGTLRPAAAAALGLEPGCRVAVGTGDEHAACVAAGVLRPGIVCDIAGTAEPVAAASAALVIDPDGIVETHAHVPADRWLVENPGFVSAGSVRWLAESVLGCSQADVAALAAEAPAGSAGVLFLPALGGSVTPRWNEDARASFSGLAIGQDRRHLARAVIEGCAFALRDVVDRLAGLDLAGDVIRVVGGSARNRLGLQIKADVTGRRIEVLTEPEATAYGAGLIAATAAGWFADLDEAAAATLRLAGDPILPEPHDQAVYEDAYGRYRATYDALEPTFGAV
ncbi:MAG TPA: FGGY family carbohydrate kinase [Candidatus Deferrimicrobium sp.]|nr:FGGY family carbohydrate kinase [Candidatus Deferrimicrobium sp.]